MRIGSLCTGYGGLDMALDATTAWVSDIDKAACTLLAYRFPDVPNLGDLTAVDWEEVTVMGAPRNDALAEMMYDLYCQGLSIEQIANQSNRSRQTIHKMFQRRGYELRPVRGPDRHGVEYGGQRYTLGNQGYLRRTTGDRELLHRRIWSDIYGAIPGGYDIHHIDHNKLNNEISNLQLLSKSDHAALHAALEEVVPIDSPTVDVLTAGYP